MSHPAVFLDRDDTLIEDPGYINHPDQVRLLPHAADALVELRRLGYKLVIVTNQSAVARGIVTEEGLAEIHQRLVDLLRREGATVDGIYYCPYHPNGIIPEYRRESDLRKPNPGMLLLAAEEMDLELGRSWMLGNSYRDIAAGQRAGCRTILITSAEKPATKKPTDPVPFKKAVNLREAVNIIKTHDQHRPIARAERPVQTGIGATAPPRAVHEIPPATADEPVVRASPHDATDTEPAEELFDTRQARHRPKWRLRSQSQTVSEPAEAEAAPSRQTPTPEAPPPGAPPHEAPAREVPAEPANTFEQLNEVIRLLRRIGRQEMFHEFSVMKALAGVVQVAVVFFLMWSLWWVLDASRPIAQVHTLLAYAGVLQLMVIAFYMMRDRR